MKGYVFVTMHPNGMDVILIHTTLTFHKQNVYQLSEFTRDTAKQLSAWFPNPQDYRYIMPTYEEFSRFVAALERIKPHLPRYYVQVVKSRFWNIISEINYRLKCPKTFPMEDLLHLYGLTRTSHQLPYISDCFDLCALAAIYESDTKTSTAITKSGYLTVLKEQYSALSLDQLFQLAFQVGYQLTVISKPDIGFRLIAKGREVGVENTACDSEGITLKDALVDLHMKKFE